MIFRKIYITASLLRHVRARICQVNLDLHQVTNALSFVFGRKSQGFSQANHHHSNCPKRPIGPFQTISTTNVTQNRNLISHVHTWPLTTIQVIYSQVGLAYNECNQEGLSLGSDNLADFCPSPFAYSTPHSSFNPHILLRHTSLPTKAHQIYGKVAFWFRQAHDSCRAPSSQLKNIINKCKHPSPMGFSFLRILRPLQV